MHEPIKLLDHGYLRLVEAWGHGDAGEEAASADDDRPVDMECGIIEAARQSTQGSFRGWEDQKCGSCQATITDLTSVLYGRMTVQNPDGTWRLCPDCDGTGVQRGDARLLKFLFSGKPQHATPFEFSGMTIEVQAPIAVFREWHRHRVQSFEETGFNALDNLDDTAFNEMSARYAPLPDLNYVPTSERCMRHAGKNKQASAMTGAAELTGDAAIRWMSCLEETYRQCEACYQLGLGWGIPKELARLCLPVGRYSRMRASANLRNWCAFLTLRMDPAAMWEIQQYANALGTIVAQQFPRTWKLYCDRA